MSKFERVEIVWKDITAKSGWINQEEADEFVMDEKENIVNQIGYLYEEDENQVILLNSYFSYMDLLGDLIKIPRGNVLEIKKL